MPTLQLKNQTLYYQTVGAGDPLLLMHGWTMIGDEMLPLANVLAGYGLQVIVPDLPGYGKSVPPYRTFPPDFYQRDAAQMVAFLDALGLKQVHIMGFSDGGETALLLPILRPDLCRTVIAWGAIGAFPAELCEQQRRGLPHTWITNAHRAQHPGQNMDVWPEQWVKAFCAIIEQNDGDVSMSKAHTIVCPTLIMLGDQDRLNPIAYGEKFVSRLRDGLGTLEVFPNVGHAIHTERPLEFVGAITRFWEKHGFRYGSAYGR